MRSDVVFGSGVNTTWPDGSGTIWPAAAAGSLRVIESRTSASPSGSTSLPSTSNVVGRPRRVEAMSLCASGGRLALPSDGATCTVTVAEALASRPSVIVYPNVTVPTKPAAGETWTLRPSGAICTRPSPPVGSTDATTRTSPFGSVSLSSTSMSIGRSTRVWAASSRAIGGRFGPSWSISSDCTISAFGSSGLTSVMTSPPCSSVLSSESSSSSRDRTAPQSSTRSRRCCGLVTHAAPVSTSLIHTHPLTSRRRSSEPAPSSGARCTSVQPPWPSPHHWANAAGAVDTAKTQPPNAIGAVGAVPGSWPTSVISVPSPPSGMVTRRPSVVAATTWSAAAPGCCRITGDALPSAPGTATSSGAADPGVARTRSPSGSASTAVSFPSDVIDTTSSVRSTGGLTSVSPSGRRKTTSPAASSTSTACPSGVAADRVPPSPVTIASTSSVEATDSSCSRSSFQTAIDCWSTISAPPSTACTATSWPTRTPAGLATRSTVSSTTVTTPVVRSWTTMIPGAWSTSKSEPGSATLTAAVTSPTSRLT